MILSYSCFAIAWIGFFLSWDEMTPLGRVLFAIIAVATITLVRDAHKRRQEASTSHYSDYINESDLIWFDYDAGEPASPYGTITVGVANGKEPVELYDADGCTDPKTSSRKRNTFLSDFYEFCEENGYSQEERPLVFQEWVND